MLKHFMLVGCCLFVAFGLARAADEHWQTLNGPYWANGIDVAYGTSGQNEQWFRYLIGPENGDTRVFGWPSSQGSWFYVSPPYSGANKVVSYKEDPNGNWAVFSKFEDDIYRTEDGGSFWLNLSFPPEYNRRDPKPRADTW
jgi:hypothetical protein